MSTKGASNRYGNSRGGMQGHETEHTGFAWAKSFNKTTLARHFNDHGKQLGLNSIESYGAHAIKFANTIDRKNNLQTKLKNGTTIKYNKKTNEYAMITKKGIVITYFLPKDGINYYRKQGGK